MKRILSFILLLTLLLSLCGCTVGTITSETTLPQTTVLETVPQQTQPEDTPEPAEKIVIPYLIGKNIHELPATDNYTVVEKEQIHSSEAIGTILSQEPEGGAWVDKGTTIYVVTSLDQKEGSEQPPVTEPIYWEPSDQDQNEPPRTDNNSSQPEQPRPSDPQPEQPTVTEPPATQPPATESRLDPNGSYTSKDDVALFIKTYGRLPNNFITKNQAENMYGKTNGLNKYGKCIGGDRFYNREGKLPSGYTYYECDIGTLYSSSRGAKRLVFTYSGIVYYTSDHYETFTRLY